MKTIRFCYAKSNKPTKLFFMCGKISSKKCKILILLSNKVALFIFYKFHPKIDAKIIL